MKQDVLPKHPPLPDLPQDYAQLDILDILKLFDALGQNSQSDVIEKEAQKALDVHTENYDISDLHLWLSNFYAYHRKYKKALYHAECAFHTQKTTSILMYALHNCLFLSAATGNKPKVQQYTYEILQHKDLAHELSEKNIALILNILVHYEHHDDAAVFADFCHALIQDDQNKCSLVAAYYKANWFESALDICDTLKPEMLVSECLEEFYKLSCEKIGDIDRWYKKHAQIADSFETATQKKWGSPMARRMRRLQLPQSVIATGLTVDLKHLADGSIRALEFNMLPASGLTGYDRLHKHLLRPKIQTAYDQFWNQFSLQKIGQNPLVADFRGYNGHQKINGFLARVVQPDVIQNNTSLNAWLMAYYKDDFAYHAHQLGLDPFVPQSVIASKYDHPSTTMHAVNESIRGDHVIVKPCNDAVGDGVMVVTKTDLPDVIKAINYGHHWHHHAEGHVWAQDYHPNFMIQECVRSKPCRAEDGQYYDGTIRVALTHFYDSETHKSEIMFHGMYWKLPPKPINGVCNDTSVISTPPSKLDNDSVAITSARVSPLRQKQVKDQLTQFFTKLASHFGQLNHQAIQERLTVAQDNPQSPIAHTFHEQASCSDFGVLQEMLATPETRQGFVTNLFYNTGHNSHLAKIKTIASEFYAALPLRDRHLLVTRHPQYRSPYL